MWFLPIIDTVLGGIRDVVKAKVTDVNLAAQIEADMTKKVMELDWAQVQGQLTINLEEAKHQSIFVAGWRPAVGWVCGSALAYNYVLQPFMAFLAGLYLKSLPPLPTLDTASLMGILTGMLGFGAMRSYEKVKSKNNGGS